MGIVASLAASQVAHEVIEDEARRELVKTIELFLGLSSENHQVRKGSLALLLSNHGSHWLYPFHQVGGNVGRGGYKNLIEST